jgi:hypothetical protein
MTTVTNALLVASEFVDCTDPVDDSGLADAGAALAVDPAITDNTRPLNNAANE